MRESHEDLPGLDEGVHDLRSEHLFHEFLSEHCLDDVLEDLLRSICSNILAPEPLIKDIDHLTSEIDDDKGQAVYKGSLLFLILNITLHFNWIIILN